MKPWLYYVQRHAGPMWCAGTWETWAGPFTRHSNARRLLRALQRIQRRHGHTHTHYRVRKYHPNDPRQTPRFTTTRL